MTEESKVIKTSEWKEKQRVKPKAFMPNEGFVRNPLLSKAPNDPCWCGSGKKWKKCCLGRMPLYIPESELADHLAFMGIGDEKPNLRAVDENFKVNPVLEIETRPSEFTGHSWWAVLTYKHHRFEEMLPFELPSMDEAQQEAAIAKVEPLLLAKLRPILEAEDAALQNPKMEAQHDSL